MSYTKLSGSIVLEWLEKWPDLPNKQLARMIYNADNNNMVFTDEEHARAQIRYYKGKSGNAARNKLANRKHIKNEQQFQST